MRATNQDNNERSKLNLRELLEELEQEKAAKLRVTGNLTQEQISALLRDK